MGRPTIRIISPARAVWIDLAAHEERLLDAGEQEMPETADGFLWVDVELPAPEAVDALRSAGAVPPGVDLADESAARVESAHLPDHLHLSFAGARLDGDALVLDRRHVVVGDRVVTTLHQGVRDHFDAMRARYADGLRRFARSHGFLLFEIAAQLADEHRRAVRGLGDRIDDLRLGGPERGDGAELLASLLVLRRLLAGTRDVLSEISSRRSPFVPETTQPYLRDIAGRFDGLVTDLAFSRDVLDEALRSGERGAAAHAPTAPAQASVGPPALSIRSLGGLEVRRGGEVVGHDALGGAHGRELLAALLAARRPVPRRQIAERLWPALPADQAARALTDAVAALRDALGDDVVASDGSAVGVALRPGDTWDVDELLGIDVMAIAPEHRIDRLRALLESHDRPFCPEWPHADWGREVREDQARSLFRLRLALAEELLAAGRLDEAGPHFERVLEEDPAHEAGHRGVMRLHARAGRTPMALRQFHACRSVLRQTQGAEPGPATLALYLEILGRR